MARAAKQALGFNDALAQLETLIQSIERGELSLEDALDSYKHGMELLRLCQSKLTEVEQQIKVLDNNELFALDKTNA